MYCTDFMCTYRSHEDTDTDHLYRMQLLQALHLSKWDDETVEERINELKWKSLSPYYRLVLKKEDVLSNKFKSKEKKRELTYYIKTNGFLLFLLCFVYFVKAWLNHIRRVYILELDRNYINSKFIFV